MANTNIGLVEFAYSILGCAYLYGDNGKLVTEELIQAKARQYPLVFTPDYIVRSRQGIGRIGYDCSSVIDCYTGYDKSANGWFDVATFKGDISTMPNKKGILVHMDGHVGVYVGDGFVIEARGVDFGVVKTRLVDRPWKRWSQCPYITYIEDVVVITPEPFTLTRVLNEGDKGEDVKIIQQIVGVSADGNFGPVTAAAVKNWQVVHGLTADGQVGPATCAAMGGTWAPKTVVAPASTRPVNPYIMPTYTLYKGKFGMSRNDVKWLQFELNWRYGSAIVIDGSFGAITDKYLRQFQANTGLGVDGKCGPLTKEKLKTTAK